MVHVMRLFGGSDASSKAGQKMRKTEKETEVFGVLW